MKHEHHHVVEVKGLEKLKQNVARVKTHVKENKKYYITGAVSGGSCLALGYILRGNLETKQVLENYPRICGLSYKSTQTINNTVTQTMIRQGEPGKKTFWVEKGVWFPSRGAAAQAAKLSKSSVVNCCLGRVDSVKDQHFICGGDMN